tara:strand:- start:2060 stop:3085 length:1026 start_codon:yes stop_codon:yes gene_type:complete
MKEVLESMGYKLIDNGDHWRTNALYRDGDNPTAVKIYKNTGVWSDFVRFESPKPLELLVKLTLEGDKEKLTTVLKSLNSNDTEITEYKQNTLIQMEKTYEDSVLDKLFPNYNFYLDKNISEDTQKAFKVGLAGGGNMYRRMVFPIYNEHSQIIGFSGRKVDDNDYAKWKHLGKKNNWIYPAYVPNKETVDSIIDEKCEVYLVESIGDAMSLHQQGIKNVLVIFGLSVSSSIITYLSSKKIDRVILAGNNDFNSKENRGLMASIKNYLKLSNYFDLDALCIKNPPKGFNDLGDAHFQEVDLASWSKEIPDSKEQRKFISDFVADNEMKFSKTHIRKASKLNE